MLGIKTAKFSISLKDLGLSRLSCVNIILATKFAFIPKNSIVRRTPLTKNILKLNLH